MAAAFSPSIACCTVPAVIGPPYEPKGAFIELDGIKIYGNGPNTANKALFILYDVFGYSTQILQGADFLASQGYKVFMPDFWQGRPAPMRWMPMPDVFGKEGPVDEKALDDFCNGPGNTEQTVKKAFRLREAFQRMNPDVERWGLVGYCWGGYVANFMLDDQSPFLACAELHPGFPGKDIAESIARPILALCSKDEPEREYGNFQPHLKVESNFVHFNDMVHGWLSARGDLYKPHVQLQFQRGYEMVAEWFSRYL